MLAEGQNGENTLYMIYGSVSPKQEHWSNLHVFMERKIYPLLANLPPKSVRQEGVFCFLLQAAGPGITTLGWMVTMWCTTSAAMWQLGDVLKIMSRNEQLPVNQALFVYPCPSYSSTHTHTMSSSSTHTNTLLCPVFTLHSPAHPPKHDMNLTAMLLILNCRWLCLLSFLQKLLSNKTYQMKNPTL